MRTRPELDERDDIDRLASWVRWGISIAGAAGLTALAHSFFNWSDFINLIAAAAPEEIMKVILFLLVALGLMFATARDYLLAGATFLYWTVLTILGQMVRDRTDEMFLESWRWYAQRRMFFDADKVARVRFYFYGWQMKLRNKVGFALVGIFCILTIPQVRAAVGSAAHAIEPRLPEAAAAALAPAVWFAIFVFVTEGWQYWMRLNIFATVSVLNKLKISYDIEPFAKGDAGA